MEIRTEITITLLTPTAVTLVQRRCVGEEQLGQSVPRCFRNTDEDRIAVKHYLKDQDCECGCVEKAIFSMWATSRR